MTMFVFNTTRTESTTYVVSATNDVILGRDAFWINTVEEAMFLGSLNTIFIAGQMYSDFTAITSSSGNNRIDIAATGIIFSARWYALDLAGTTNYVTNAGQLTGNLGISTDTSSNTIVNSGIISTNGDAILIGGGAGNTTITNSGTLASGIDDGIQVEGDGTITIDNSGTISAARSSAINALGSGILLVTNTGTIAGVDAVLGGDTVDRVINSGAMSGRIFLFSGDDLFDTSLGITEGIVDAGGGNDTLIGSALADRFLGGEGDDTLSGNDGDDLLTGGAGADDLDGGAGSDTASYVGSVEVTVDLADALRNAGDAFGDTFVSIENVIGTAFADILSGDAERNRLRGGDGDDVLDGRGGADRLVGGIGDDTYVVDNRGDRVVEGFGEGSDTVTTTISLTLPDFVENLILIGTAALNGAGNVGANQIFGNSGANVLDGLFGNDFLTGGAGADQFRFTTPLDGLNNVDTILDFTPGADRIALSRTVFNPLGGGAAGLQAAAFVTGTAAGDANDRIIYDPVAGRLYYDPDGNGAIAQTLFARIDGGVVLTATDFIVFG